MEIHKLVFFNQYVEVCLMITFPFLIRQNLAKIALHPQCKQLKWDSLTGFNPSERSFFSSCPLVRSQTWQGVSLICSTESITYIYFCVPWQHTRLCGVCLWHGGGGQHIHRTFQGTEIPRLYLDSLSWGEGSKTKVQQTVNRLQLAHILRHTRPMARIKTQDS